MTTRFKEVLSACARDGVRPDWDTSGVPGCQDACPQFDGKRCRIVCARPVRICEPAVVLMATALKVSGA